MKVSIITPTTPDRSEMVRRLSAMVAAQTFRDFEWLTDENPGTIGEKRNRLCQRAKGEIIVMFDSDDSYAPDYVERCVNHMEEKKATCTGLSSAYFASKDQAWHYTYGGSQPYCMGSGMAFYKWIWERNKFPEISEGEDAIFCSMAGRVIAHDYRTGALFTIHDSNTASHKALSSMKPVAFQTVDYAKDWGLLPTLQP